MRDGRDGTQSEVRAVSGVHCEHFPSCMELGQNATIPECDKLDCPGNKTWAGIIPAQQQLDSCPKNTQLSPGD